MLIISMFNLNHPHPLPLSQRERGEFPDMLSIILSQNGEGTI
jgi:hypothetical protein